MKLEYLQTLAVVLETGSFSKAAENLCVTQSAVSRRIKMLEDDYGSILVDRSGATLKATREGTIVLEKAQHILAMDQDIRNKLSATRTTLDISFCCTPAFGVAYLPAVMKKLLLMRPDMDALKLYSDMPEKVLEGLEQGTYQVGVIEYVDPPDLAAFTAISLPEDQVLFVSAPTIGLSEGEMTIEQLVSQNLYIRKEGCCSSKLLAANLEIFGKSFADFNRVIFCDDLHFIINEVCSGSGIAFVSRAVVEDLLWEKKLRQHQITGFQHTFQRTLVMHRNARTEPLFDNLVHCIKNVF